MSGPVTSPLRSALALAAFALVTVGAIALTRVLTAERIEQQRAGHEARLLAELLPAQRFGTAQLMPLDRIEDPRLGPGPRALLLARHADGTGERALVVPLRLTDGYSGDIEALLAVAENGTVAGVRVTSHRETPGLGDLIERRKSAWIEQFTGRSLGDPPAAAWQLRREGGDFDGLTGASITARALVRGVARGLDWYEDEGRVLLDAAEPTE